VNECVPALDEGVGQLIAALEATGQLTNTLVVYVADQGFGMGEHGFRTKLAPYDATYRSPLIVSFPGVIPKGGYCPQSVNGADLVATIAQFAKLTIPWSTHGRDLMPLLKNPNASWPYPCLYEHLGEHYGSDVFKVMNTNPAEAEYHKVPWYVAVVQERWKLIHYLKPGVGDELYDLQTDPEELTNAIAQPTNMERLTRLQASLTSELRRTGAGGLVPKDFGH
jgi:arylsulfatase A-like enzyme